MDYNFMLITFFYDKNDVFIDRYVFFPAVVKFS